MSSLCSLSGYDKEIMTVDHNGCRIVAATKCYFFYFVPSQLDILFQWQSKVTVSFVPYFSIYIFKYFLACSCPQYT